MQKTDLDAFVAGLEVAMQQTGWKAAPLSEAAGMGTTAVRDLFRRNVSPKVSTAAAIARVLGMSIDDIIGLSNATPNSPPTLPVAGRVGAGARVPLYDATDEGGLFRVVIPHQLRRFATGNHLAAVEVEGDSMQPMYQPGDLLFFSRASHEAPLAEDIGRPCVIEDADGMAWVKQLKTGDEPGLYHLISLNPGAQTRHNQRIRWASRILMALPTELVDRA